MVLKNNNIWLVSRHQGAIEWATSFDVPFDRVVMHLDIEQVVAGDVVCGVFPLRLVVQLLKKSARVFAIELPLGFEHRGHELSAAQMRQLGAYWLEYISIKSVALKDFKSAVSLPLKGEG